MFFPQETSCSKPHRIVVIEIPMNNRDSPSFYYDKLPLVVKIFVFLYFISQVITFEIHYWVWKDIEASSDKQEKKEENDK